MRALLSVYDKTGIVDFARGLVSLGVELYSTGGTEGLLAESGVPVTGVQELTGFPEVLGGRVKTLHPLIYSGILAVRDDPGHMEQLGHLNVQPFDLIVVNLYPFLKVVREQGAELDEALENIDIGGPTLLRASAKNFNSVLPVCDPQDYSTVLDALQNDGVSQDIRRRLAAKAFQHCAVYDTHIAGYLRPSDDLFPDEYTLALSKRAELRYGENPHQPVSYTHLTLPTKA